MTHHDTTLRLPLTVAAATLVAGSAALAEGVPEYLDAAWRGFDTGAYTETGSPHTLAVADLDGDGDIDAVAGREYYWRPGITVLMNHGDGTYDAPVHYQLGNYQVIGEIRVADIDVDGDPDVLATVPGDSHRYNIVALWRNQGDGTFVPPRMFTTQARGPIGLVLADFTGDGFLDAVTANRDYAYAGTTVSLLPHNGLTGADAGFLAPTTFEIGPSPQRVAAEDIDGDGWPDLAVGFGRNPNAWCSILINDQQGGFTTTATYDVDGYAEPFVGLADLDNDGDPELLTGSYDYTYNSGMLYIQRNLGDGTFAGTETYQLANAEWPRGIDFADINGDGYTDVLCAHPNGRRAESWSLLASNGSGGFHPAVRYPSSQNSYGVRAADVDADGDIDVLSLAELSNALTVHRNDGTGTFPRMTLYELPYIQTGIDAGDIDLDGDLDLVTAAEDISILRNNGDGTYEPAEGMLSPLNPWDIKLRDLNGDGYVDILVGPDGVHPPYDFGTAINRGDGTFERGVRWGMNACGPGDVDAFDLDADGDLDVVFAEELACVGQYNGWIFIARNRGDGTFDLLLRVEMPIGCRGIQAADLNHDGHLDLVTAQAGIGVALGNGDLTFQPALITSDPYYAMTLVELNGDGHLDAATVTIGWTNEVGIALGNGDGTFQAATMYQGSSSLDLGVGVDVDAADVDLDGDADIVVSNYASNDLSLFIHNGDGTLQPQARYGPGINPFESVFDDFTGDGTPDVATLVQELDGGSAVAIVRGTTTGGVTGDVDGDGVVSFSDLLAILAAWGPCEGECPEDLDGDGAVGFADLLIVLSNWS